MACFELNLLRDFFKHALLVYWGRFQGFELRRIF
jgi:hypothetical protein